MRIKTFHHCTRHVSDLPLTLFVIAFGPEAELEAVVNFEYTFLIATLAWSLPIFAIVMLSVAAPFMRGSRSRGAHRSVDKLITYTSSRGVADLALLAREFMRRPGGAP
jgi:hypothetical protein